MRALSFLFAALLGIALAMIAPALAGPRGAAPVQDLPMAAVVSTEIDSATGEQVQPALDGLAPSDLQAEAQIGDDGALLSADEISRSILESLDFSADPA